MQLFAAELCVSGGCNVKEENVQQLIAFGRGLMARVAGGEAAPDPPWTAAYLNLLNPQRLVGVPGEPSQSIFTLVRIESQTAAPVYLRPVPLDLPPETDPAAWPLMPVDRATAAGADRPALYRQFVQAGGETETSFTRFFHLMRKYASTLPNSYGEPGVSLFEQWKIVAALVGISGDLAQPPEKLGLVGGDIPGIQRTINLVTSKGAAKAMRGRSAFIQLLGHALVERLLDELDLGSANVVYDAGGNFVLLTGWDERLAAKVQVVADAVNRVLLGGAGQGREHFDGFHGDLAVALAAVELRPDPQKLPVQSAVEVLRADLPPVQMADGKPASRWQFAEKLLKDAVAAAKERPFGDLAAASKENWDLLFAPEPAETDDFCAVCRRQRRRNERFVPLDPDAPEEVGIGSNLQCLECAGFGELARALGQSNARLVLSSQRPAEPSAWQRALYAVAGRWYALPRAGSDGVTLALDLDGFPATRVHGFRLLARTTPLTPEGGIKPNDRLVAESGIGFKRLGVLRMDVDDLGNLLVHGLPRRMPMQTAELSQTLERFFAGWLDRICRRVDKGEDLFYVLFAGGDDLFVIGPWSLMPGLAQAIRNDFRAYTAGHDGIHLSAGIAVVGEKAPLYAAADESHEALEAAKKLDRDTPREKNAITFLGRSHHWDDFAEVERLKETLVGLLQLDRLPASLLTTLQGIERRWRQDIEHDARLEHEPDKRPDVCKRGKWGDRPAGASRTVRVYYGPWMWRQAYALARAAEGHPRHVKEKLETLRDALLEGKIAYLGLAARWAQWELRKENST
jgi:CRISPR-associated protein Csm1